MNTEGEKVLIKNIIYLDIDKMYSMSSQVFEGVTEYIVNEKMQGGERGETQKGPIASGKLLGDIIRQQETVSEKKILVDHSYTLFEKKLIDEGRVILVNSSTNNSADEKSFLPNTFIKVKAKAIFNDMSSIRANISNFNKLGRALATVTMATPINALKAELEELRKSGGSENRRKVIESELKSFSTPEKMQRISGLYQEPEFLNQLATTLEYGYQDQLEVSMEVDAKIFSADLKRECLREREDMIIRKYSRHSEVEFVVFGVLTQVNSKPGEVGVAREGETIKEAIMNVVGTLTNLESTFTGRLPNEMIIDPIAIYTEIR